MRNKHLTLLATGIGTRITANMAHYIVYCDLHKLGTVATYNIDLGSYWRLSYLDIIIILEAIWVVLASLNTHHLFLEISHQS
jgi:hypothetical protein